MKSAKTASPAARHAVGILHFAGTVASLIMLTTMSGAFAHGIETHDAQVEVDTDQLAGSPGEPMDGASSVQGHVQVFEAETLLIPNAPVTDSEYVTEGFVSRLHDHGPLLISFTYTGCETLCPVSNAILQQVDRQLSESESPALHIVTLSIDPERDTPEALAENARLLGASDHWTSLTADPHSNRLLLESLGVEPGLVEEHDPMFLIGDLRSGRFVRLVGMPEPRRILQIAQSIEP